MLMYSILFSSLFCNISPTKQKRVTGAKNSVLPEAAGSIEYRKPSSRNSRRMSYLLYFIFHNIKILFLKIYAFTYYLIALCSVLDSPM